MEEKLNDFRNKSEAEVFEMYKKIALKDYLYSEMHNCNKQEISNFNTKKEDVYDFNDVINGEVNNNE